MTVPSRPHSGRPSLSVVVPIRDEAEVLAELHRRLREALPADAEIVMVDDGSVDRSREVLAGIVRDDPGVVALSLPRSLGKSHALAVGFERCRGRFIATIDADLQEDPGEIPRLLRLLRGEDGSAPDGVYDLVTGWRRRRRDALLKVLGSRIFNLVIRLLSGLRLLDINCGLKVMRREVVETMHLEVGYHRFIPLLAHWKGFHVGEVEVDHAPRRHGSSRYGTERLLHGVIDFLVLLFLERFERRPSRLFLSAGALLLLTGLGICVFITYLRLTTGTIQSKYPLLTFGVLLLVVGVQVISTGFLAELVAQRHRIVSDDRLGAVDIGRPQESGASAELSASGAPGSDSPRSGR